MGLNDLLLLCRHLPVPLLGNFPTSSFISEELLFHMFDSFFCLEQSN